MRREFRGIWAQQGDNVRTVYWPGSLGGALHTSRARDVSEGQAPENRCFLTAVLEKTLESPLDCKELKPAHPKGDQPWIFTGKTDAEAETPILWPPDVKNWRIWKDPDAGKDWRQEEKGTTEDEMVGCHHRLNGHEFEQTLWESEGHRSLVCSSPWGCKKLDTTERLNSNKGMEAI